MLESNLSGAPILGGSEDGFNASITLTLVLALLIVPLVLRLPLRSPTNNEAAA